MRGFHVGHPVAHGFANCIFQSTAPASHADNLRAQHPHPEDVEALATHVLFAHIDDAFQAKERANRGACHAVLASSGFCDDALFAHAPGEQSLSQAVVDLVRAGVQQVFTLDINLCAARNFAQPLGVIERSRAPGVVREQILELGLKRGIETRFEIRLLQLLERRHQDFGNVATAVGAEVASCVWGGWLLVAGCWLLVGHAWSALHRSSYELSHFVVVF